MDISLSGTPALIAIIVFLGLPVWFVVIVIARIRRKAHDINIKWDNIVKAEYEPPLSLTPAELGYLTDSKFDKKEMVATLLDLEQRGFVNINKSSYGYEIVKIGSDSNSLSAHEKFIYESKTSGNEILNLLTGNRNKFKNLVRQDLHEKGLVKKTAINISITLRRILVLYLVLNISTSIYFLIHEIAAGDIGEAIFFFFMSPLFMSPLFVPISIIGGYIYNSVVGDTFLWTTKMKSAWADVEGYKEYVRQVELDNIQFESKELKQKSKIKALPYAVAMGFNTDWQKRF